MRRIETSILSHLVRDEQFLKNTIPFLKEEYFSERSDMLIFKYVKAFVAKYNKPPKIETLEVSVTEASGIDENTHREMLETIYQIKDLPPEDLSDTDWMTDQTEEFCKERSLHNAIMESIGIIQGESKQLDKGAIPELLKEALAVSFDSSVGHDYLEDADSRFDYYHKKEDKIPFDIELLNKVTNGGLPRKTLSVILGGCVHPETKIRIRKRKFKDS